MKLRVGKVAERQIERIAAWWAEHRPAASGLFLDELEQAFGRLRSYPGSGVACPTPRRPQLRRLLLPATENHLYFRFDAGTDTVYVLAVWGAPRGREPRL